MSDLIVPDEAVQIVAEHCFGLGTGIAQEITEVALADASPLIAAAELERFAAHMRAALHQLPEYTHGCLAWRVMNDIDTRVQDLRSAVGVS